MLLSRRRWLSLHQPSLSQNHKCWITNSPSEVANEPRRGWRHLFASRQETFPALFLCFRQSISQEKSWCPTGLWHSTWALFQWACGKVSLVYWILTDNPMSLQQRNYLQYMITTFSYLVLFSRHSMRVGMMEVSNIIFFECTYILWISKSFHSTPTGKGTDSTALQIVTCLHKTCGWHSCWSQLCCSCTEGTVRRLHSSLHPPCQMKMDGVMIGRFQLVIKITINTQNSR